MKLYNYLKERLCADKMTYIFLDEVQEVSSFEKVVDSLYIRDYVDVYSELRGLGIFSYEHESRELAQKIFGIAELPTKANLSEAEQQMLAYYLGASTYGTIENRILNQMQKLQPDDGAFTARTKRKYR